MSEFVLVVPEGWTRIDMNMLYSNGMNGETISAQISSLGFAAITDELHAIGAIPLDQSVFDARIFDNEYFIVKLG